MRCGLPVNRGLWTVIYPRLAAGIQTYLTPLS
jgi:hypothetical protein